MSRAQMTVLAVVVGVAIFLGVAVATALVVFSVMSTRDMVRLDSQVRELTSVVAVLKQSLQEASSSSELRLETLNLTLEERSSSTERRLQTLNLTLEEKTSSTEGRLDILTSSVDVKFDTLNSSFTTSQHAVSSNQTALASRQDMLERSTVQLRSCQEYRDKGHLTSGVYILNLGDGGAPFPVYCDMRSDGYGCAVFQRRVDGSEDFYRTWADYKAGFGRLGAEFWLGNDKLHRLTSAGLTRLRVDLGDWENNTAYALYSSFSVAEEGDNYRLSVSGYSGTAGDSLSAFSKVQFTTKDRDNDKASYNCAEDRTGAWWYYDCTNTNLNGLYNITATGDKKAVYWDRWKGRRPLKSTEMKVR